MIGLGGPGSFALHSAAIFALAFEADTDGDGMSDHAEFLLGAVGLDWQVSQPALVAAIHAGLASARYFTQSQYDAARTAGQNDVLQAPNLYGLFTLSQVQSMNAGTPLLTRDANGQFKLRLRLQRATSPSQPFVAFPFVTGQTVINGSGEIEFTFAAPENAAFFRLLSQ